MDKAKGNFSLWEDEHSGRRRICMLMITHACNLNCSYCYESHKRNSYMTTEQAKHDFGGSNGYRYHSKSGKGQRPCPKAAAVCGGFFVGRGQGAHAAHAGKLDIYRMGSRIRRRGR